MNVYHEIFMVNNRSLKNVPPWKALEIVYLHWNPSDQRSGSPKHGPEGPMDHIIYLYWMQCSKPKWVKETVPKWVLLLAIKVQGESNHLQTYKEMNTEVVIVGAGPSGLATSACLNHFSIPNIILEREDCCASLWKKRAYDRVNLHLAQGFCYLPHKPHPPTTTYISKQNFINYIEEYVDQFNVNPIYCRSVESAYYDKAIGRWRVVARNTLSDGEEEEYICMYLVVATGENSEGYIPDIGGLGSFNGDVLHSSQFKSGREFAGKAMLVVGCGNSGMEIALDLANHGAITSIVIRNPVHVVTRKMVHLGMVLLKYVPLGLVDALTLILSRLKFGNLPKYGIIRPTGGPFYLKAITGRSPAIDVGTVAKIKAGEIQVLPALESFQNNIAVFADGRHWL